MKTINIKLHISNFTNEHHVFITYGRYLEDKAVSTKTALLKYIAYAEEELDEGTFDFLLE